MKSIEELMRICNTDGEQYTLKYIEHDLWTDKRIFKWLIEGLEIYEEIDNEKKEKEQQKIQT